MKRLFLLLALAAMSTTMFAQALDLDEWQLTMPKAIDGDQLVSFSIEEGESLEGVAPQARTASSGLYYQKPGGVLYRRYYSDTGTVYYNTELIAPYFHDITFGNYSNDTSSTHWLYTKGDTSSLLEANSWGDLVYAGLTPGNTWNIPYLYNADYSQYYNMAYYENVDYATDYSHTVYGSGHFNDLIWMGWSDTKAYNEFAQHMYEEYYILGSVSAKDRTVSLADSLGNYTGEKVTVDLVCDNVAARIPAPATPMYVDGIYVHGVSFAFDNPEDAQDSSFQPLRNGAVLTMKFKDRWTNEFIDSLTATTGDWTYYSSKSTQYRSGTCMEGVLKFSKKDENGNEVPIVIDRATNVQIFGFNNKDIDLGLLGNPLEDCVERANTTYGLSYAANVMIEPTGEYNLLGVYDIFTAILQMSFNAIMDVVKVAEEYSNITISAEGTECENTDAQGDANIGGLLIQTALPWYDVNGEANYSLADAPEWITGIVAEAYGEETKTYKVTFTAAPNKSVERTATVHIQCKGYADDVDITLTQLEGDENTGIEEIVAPSATTSGVTYNLAGQRVSGTAKGIIIKDGKKIIIK